VPAVVDEDVDARHGLADLGEEAAVGLVADENGGRRVLELLAPRVDVDAATRVPAPKYSCHICSDPPWNTPTSTTTGDWPRNLSKCR